jgi:hypothetical protein
MCIWRSRTKESHYEETLRRKKKHETSTERNNTMENEKIHRKNKRETPPEK